MKYCRAILFLLLMLTAMCVKTIGQTPVWTYTYGNGQYAYGKGIIEDADGSFFVLANEGSSSNTKINIIKIDSLGDILWKKVIGSTAVYQAEDFKRTPDKGLIITGYTDENFSSSYDVLLIKTDSNANVEWEKTYGGSDWDLAHAVLALHDTTYVVAGETYSYGSGSSDIYILKLDAIGDTLWTMVYGGDSTDYATCLDTTSDGNYYVGANTKSFGAGGFDGLIMKINPFGDTLWTRIYGDSLDDVIYSIKAIADSGYIFAGSTENFGSVKHDNWVMRFFPDGTLMWSLPQPWTIGSEDDYIYNIALADSNRYVFVGFTKGAGLGGKEAALQIMGEYFDFRCSYTVGSVWDDDLVYALQTRDSGFIAVGNTDGMGPGITNILLVKSDRDCQKLNVATHVAAIEEEAIEINSGFKAFPSISDGLFTVCCNQETCRNNTGYSVFNMLGQQISTGNLDPGNTTIDLRAMPSGVYLLRLSAIQSVPCLKLIIQKN